MARTLHCSPPHARRTAPCNSRALTGRSRKSVLQARDVDGRPECAERPEDDHRKPGPRAPELAYELERHDLVPVGERDETGLTRQWLMRNESGAAVENDDGRHDRREDRLDPLPLFRIGIDDVDGCGHDFQRDGTLWAGDARGAHPHGAQLDGRPIGRLGLSGRPRTPRTWKNEQSASCGFIQREPRIRSRWNVACPSWQHPCLDASGAPVIALRTCGMPGRAFRSRVSFATPARPRIRLDARRLMR